MNCINFELIYIRKYFSLLFIGLIACLLIPLTPVYAAENSDVSATESLHCDASNCAKENALLEEKPVVEDKKLTYLDRT